MTIEEDQRLGRMDRLNWIEGEFKKVKKQSLYTRHGKRNVCVIFWDVGSVSSTTLVPGMENVSKSMRHFYDTRYKYSVCMLQIL